MCASRLLQHLGVSHSTLLICHLASVFMLLLTQINGRGYINEIQLSQTPGIIRNLGFVGNAIYYLIFGISTTFTISLTERLGPVRSMIIGSFFTFFYELSFIYVTNISYIFFNVLAGLGASLSWPAMGYYIERTTNPADALRHNSLCWGISQLSQISSPVILIFLFYLKQGTEGMFTETTLHLTQLFFASVLASAIFTLMRLPEIASTQTRRTFETIRDLWQLSKTLKMRCLLPVYLHSGFSQALWMSILPSMVSNNKALGGDGLMNMALGALCTGFGELSVCVFAFFVVRRYISNKAFVGICGTTFQWAIAISLYLWFPSDVAKNVSNEPTILTPSIYIIFLITYFVGFSDGTFNILIYEATEEFFIGESLTSFVTFNFVQCLSTAFAFSMISMIPLGYACLAYAITSFFALYGYSSLLKRCSIPH